MSTQDPVRTIRWVGALAVLGLAAVHSLPAYAVCQGLFFVPAPLCSGPGSPPNCMARCACSLDELGVGAEAFNCATGAFQGVLTTCFCPSTPLNYCVDDQTSQPCEPSVCPDNTYQCMSKGCCPKDDGPAPGDACLLRGDPFSVDTGSSVHEAKDIALGDAPTFTRHFNSQPESWLVGNPVIGVPTPFGASPANGSALEWWHTYFSLVFERSGSLHVRRPDGSLLRFQACTAPCWASPSQSNQSIPERLKRTTAGFELTEKDGTRLVYATAHVAVDATRYFLSEVWGASGTRVATLMYAAPQGLTCQLGNVGSAPGAPYLAFIVTPGATLALQYTSLTYPNGSTACVLQSVSRAIGGVNTTLVSYSYWNDGAAVRPGRLAGATWPGGSRSEAYSYTSGALTISSSGAALSQHQYSGNRVVGDSFTGGSLSVVYQTDAGVCAQGSQCCGVLPAVRTVQDLAAGIGDGDAGSPGFVTTYAVLDDYGRKLEPRLYEVSDSCTNANSCSAGTTRMEWTCSSAGMPAYELARKDKRGNWEAYEWTLADAGASGARLERTAVKRGATDLAGANALETTRYAYSYGSAGQQRVQTVSRPSVLNAAVMATTTSQYDADNRLSATIQSGQTKTLEGVVVTRSVGTFYRKQWHCGGSPIGAVDPLNRTLQIDGPCEVSGPAAVGCTGSIYPVQRFEFFGDDGTVNANQLRFTRSYPAGCVGIALTTEYAAYDVSGNPATVTDMNFVTTTFTYQDGRLTSKRVGPGGPLTQYSYTGERLTAIQYPLGNFEVFCYRQGTGPGGCTGGTLTRQLQWKAKSSTALAASGEWTERMEYEYWPDGTVRVERALTPTEVRRETQYAADAHRRPTLTAFPSATPYRETRAYDGADNLTALGKPYNSPPAFCKAGAVTSPLCARLEYDRADRLTALEESPDATKKVRTCLSYDSSGNLTNVALGGSTDGTTPNCLSATSNDYVTDDFGNVVEVRLANTENAEVGTASDRGVARFEYDAMGNVTLRQSPQQRISGPLGGSTSIRNSYDGLGRLTLSEQNYWTSWVELYSIRYDTWATNPPSTCPQPAFARGRRASVRDPLWTTWYQYDVEGRVTAEIRQRTNLAYTACSAATQESSPVTRYYYDANGNLYAMQYPHGRFVHYAFGAGGNADRVAAVYTSYLDPAPAWRLLARDVRWEPYGGMYRHDTGHLQPGNVTTWTTTEYLLGEATSAPASPSAGCPATRTTNDKSGRVRALWVSSSASGTGDLYKKTYTWQADQVARMDTCYLGGTTSQVEDFRPSGALGGYDATLRLLSADATSSFATTGGPYRQRKFTYDARGNRLRMDVDEFNNAYQSTFSVNAWTPDKQLSVFATAGNMNGFEADADGRVYCKSWPRDSGGLSAFSLWFDYDKYAPGGSTVMQSVYRDGALYTYRFDTANRRIRKEYPLGRADVFFYDLGHQLLEDRGNANVVPTAGEEVAYPIDEYIWLGGRPVALIRGKYDANWVRQRDSAGECRRNGEAANCGVYSITTDVLGKPVLMLDSSRLVAGVGEYDVFGTVNRTQVWGESAHPYSNNTNSIIADFTQPVVRPGLGLDVRAHFTQVDTEGWCNGVYDYAQLENGDTGEMLTTGIGGAHQGDVWSSWVRAPETGHLKVRFLADGLNYAPTDPCSSSSTSTFPFTGVSMREYQYRRYQNARTWGTETSWKQTQTPGTGWQVAGYDDSAWAASVDEGAYGGSPWWGSAPFPYGTPARWIWNRDSRATGDSNVVYFRKTFVATANQVRMTITADNSFTAYLDGVFLATGSAWYAPVALTRELTPGTTHVLAIQATNAGGPGGLLVDVSESAPMWTPLRFPGQYFDAETDLHENWNRFFDPLPGRYLSPEPLLQSPAYVRLMAQRGMSVPTYAYAANNPLRYVDRNGLYYTADSWDPEDGAMRDYIWREIGRAAMDPIIGEKVLEMWASPREFKIYGRRKTGDSETNKNSCEVDFGFSANPGYSPDGYRSYNRATLWHEMGHQWAIAHGASHFETLREGVMWENRARMGLPDGSPLGEPSRLRRIHWEDENWGVNVFP